MHAWTSADVKDQTLSRVKQATNALHTVALFMYAAVCCQVVGFQPWFNIILVALGAFELPVQCKETQTSLTRLIVY